MSVCSCSGRSLLTKQQLSPEEERVVREFFSDWGDAITPAQRDLVEAVEAGDIPLSRLESIRAEVKQRLGNYTNDVDVVFSEHIKDGATTGREVAARRHQLDIAFDIVPQDTLDQLEDWAFEASDMTMENVGDEISQFLRSVHQEGLSIDDAAQALNDDYFEGRLKDWQGERIARTETIGSSNAGANSAHEDADSVVGEEWLTTIDGRQRTAHEEMDGYVVAPGQTFRLPNGETARYPGDSSLSASMRVNCRCTVVPRFADEFTEAQLASLQAGRQIYAPG